MSHRRRAAVFSALALSLALLPGWPAFAQQPSPDVLAKLEQRIRGGGLGNVHSVIVLYEGKTAAEWYFRGLDERRGVPVGVIDFTPDTLPDVRSVTKSIVSLLLGLALQDGAIKSLDVPVLDFFPEYSDLRTPERMKIRLLDLASMRSGIEWDERTYSYADPRNSEIAMDAAPDRYRYILSRPVDAPPGTRFTYSGGDVALLGEVIARATGEPLADYARRRLFAPLGIDRFEWLKDAKGIPIAASGLRLRPRDMAAIGQMMLENGRWRGRQIVPATWIREVIAQHAQVQPNAKCGTEYGYLWWLTAICLGQHRKPLFFASGNGGQDIWVAPSEHLVVVTTAGMYNIFAGDSASGEVVQTLLNARDAASH